MALRRLGIALGFALVCGLAVGCSDDSSSSDSAVPEKDNGVDVQVTEDSAPKVDQAQATGKATDLQLGLHDNKVKVVLSTMTVVGQQETTWDFWVSHGDPVDGGPQIVLGTGVTAQSLGDTKAFHDVTAAPADGYTADDEASKKYVVGATWRNGGEGTTGFSMSKFVYILKLADGTHAKIEVLSAKSGEVHILAYHQPDKSTDLTTTP